MEKISEISTRWIARYELLYSQKAFFGPCKKPGKCTLQAHICMKKCPNGGYSLDSFFKASRLHA